MTQSKLQKKRSSLSRPVFRNISITDIRRYRLPLSGWISILHRISGAGMFLGLGVGLYLFDISLTSKEDFDMLLSFLSRPFVKLVGIGFIWALAHHFFAGIRFLLIDFHIGLDRRSAHYSGCLALFLTLLTTSLLAFKWVLA